MYLDLDHSPIQLHDGAQAHDLPWSLLTITGRCFQRFPPGEAAMEAAIASIEDALMPLLPAAHSPAQARPLQVPTAWAQQFAAAAGVDQHHPLSLQRLEQVFNQLAAVVGGSPARSQGIPENTPWCMARLLVREAMHHGAFTVLEGIAQAPLRAD